MDEDLLSDISSDENDRADDCQSVVVNSTERAVENCLPVSPELIKAEEVESFVKDPSPALKEISSDDEEEVAVEKPVNSSLWLGEPKKWQQITAADFDDLRELSDTDDEFDSNILKVADTNYWSQSIVPTKYYLRNRTGGQLGTSALQQLQNSFEERVLRRIRSQRDAQLKFEPPPVPQFHSCSTCTDEPHSHDSSGDTDSSSSNSDDSSSSSFSDEEDFGLECESAARKPKTKLRRRTAADEKKKAEKRRSYRPSKQTLMAKQAIERKQTHPAALHADICFNEPDQVNDGPFCRCSWAAKQTGVRHNKFAGEKPIPKCDFNQSNIEQLHHYVLRITPNPNKFTRSPTTIEVEGIKYVFDGFSVFFHQPLPDTFPQSPMNQWNSDFVVKFEKENSPESFTIKDLELFYEYIFEDVMEMYDLDRMPNAKGDSCPIFHCMPRFARVLEDDGKEILPMSTVLKHFTDSFVLFADNESALKFYQDSNLLRDVAQTKKGRLFINPAKKPMCVRVDLLDPHDLDNDGVGFYPLFTHFGVRPSAYAYNGKPEYQRALKRFIKLRHLLSLKSRLNTEDRQKLRHGEAKLKRLRAECKIKRDIQACVSSEGFYETGLYPDVVQHAMFLILACAHVRFHWSLRVYEEERVKYTFKNKILLELALTHPSYRANYGTNPDHAKNTLNNCGILHTKGRGTSASSNSAGNLADSKSGIGRKRGITALMEIMAMQSSSKADKSASSVNHNERLEFLGDAVVEFISTVHLFFMFPELEEGGLATYRSALVQNKHLASLAKKIGLHEFMLYAHGPDLCHESDLRHAMANAFEAMMAAVFLDSNVNECDRIFSETLYGDDADLFKKWSNLPEHPLKRENPFGDRHLVELVPCLKLLTKFEEDIGIRFKYIRLLAKAFTRRNIGFNYLTL